MPITLITGPANAGKAGVVMDALVRTARAESGRCWSCPPTPTWSAIGWSWASASSPRAGRRAGLACGGPAWSASRACSPRLLRRAGSAERPLGRLARERALAAVLSAMRARDERCPPRAWCAPWRRWWGSWRWSG